MTATQLDEWWSGITIEEKERIASKLMKQPMKYPLCTAMWNNLPADRKQYIRDHCTNSHGTTANEEKEGQSMSY